MFFENMILVYNPDLDITFMDRREASLEQIWYWQEDNDDDDDDYDDAIVFVDDDQFNDGNQSVL